MSEPKPNYYHYARRSVDPEGVVFIKSQGGYEPLKPGDKDQFRRLRADFQKDPNGFSRALMRMYIASNIPCSEHYQLKQPKKIAVESLLN